jgi:hypothetical protein
MERYEVTGMKVYRLNICDDQRSPLCPGITTLLQTKLNDPGLESA